MGEKMNTPSRVPTDGKFERTKDPVARLADLKRKIEGDTEVDMEKVHSRAEEVRKHIKDDPTIDGGKVLHDPWVMPEGTSKGTAERYASALQKELKDMERDYNVGHYVLEGKGGYAGQYFVYSKISRKNK